MGGLRRALARLARKCATALLILALGIAALALWRFLRDRSDWETQRVALLRALATERAQLQSQLDAGAKKPEALRAAAAAQARRAQQAGAVIAELQNLGTWWSRHVSNRAQAKTDDERRAHLAQLQTKAGAKAAALQLEAQQAQWTNDGLEIALTENARQRATAEDGRSPTGHYLAAAWAEARWYALAAFLLLVFGAAAAKLAFFYGFAPRVGRGRPVRLADTLAARPGAGASAATAEAVLWPGETLWVKPRFLQSAAPGLRRRTRLLLSWRLPLSSLAAGGWRLAELRHAQAGGEETIVLHAGADAAARLMLVHVPEDAALVVRLGAVAGVITPAGARLALRRHWRIFFWHSWIAGRFRYLVAAGPCRLILAGAALRAETLEQRQGGLNPARRERTGTVIGFSPNLAASPARTASFRAYLRGASPLFDASFAGEGVVLCAEPAWRSAAGRLRRGARRLGDGARRMFGV